MIDRAHLEQWADMQSAKGDFPELIFRLVYASVTPFLKECDIPYGSAVYMGGPDGRVDSLQHTTYIPEGKSLLEFGTNSDFKTKAEKDYSKRSTETDIDHSETTFIFMTPRVWGDKEDWANKKKKDGIWKDVRVYDSTLLSQWIISVPPAELWLNPRVGLVSPNMIMGEERLEELLTGGAVKLKPSFYTAGREKVALDLMSKLSKPTLMAYRAASKEEAMGFILAAGKLFPEEQQKEYYSKTIVVEDKSAFRQMGVQTSMINLVPDFEDATVLHRAVSQGKIVLVPLGPDDDFNQLAVDLPSPDRFGLEKSLQDSGVELEKARRIVKDCACNLTMIKKSLDFPILRVDWLDDDNIAELAPAIIVERWNENFDGDREIMSLLCGKSYDEFRSSMILWSQKPVPPVMNVGALWRITSPLSLWSELSYIIPKNQFEHFTKLSESVLIGDEKLFSEQLRQGILNTLVLIAWHGDQFYAGDYLNQRYVDAIIKKIIANADSSRWDILARDLPLIAEASPLVFINEVSHSLEREDAPVMSLFKEEDGIFSPESNSPYLLWALENLAWLPEYLLEVSEILLKLSEKDPGGKLANRPINSLVSIFLPWCPQTTATLEERKSVLQELSRRGFIKMWDLLIALLPKNGGYTTGTHQMKWRGYDLVISHVVSRPELLAHAEFVCDLLKSLYEGEDNHLADLVDNLRSIPFAIRRDMISWIKESVSLLSTPLPETRKQLREILWSQKNLDDDSPFKMTEPEIEDIRAIYNAVTPTDIVERDRWLFDEFAPRLPEVVEDDDKEDTFVEMKAINRRREEALRGWIMSLPLDEVVNIKERVREPNVFGRILGHFYVTEGLNELVFKQLSIEDEVSFVGGYIQGMEEVRGEDDTLHYLDSIKSDLSDSQLSTVLHFLSPSPTLFHYVESTSHEVEESYWSQYSFGTFGHFDDNNHFILKKLLSVGRALEALNGSWHMVKEMPTDLLQRMLQEALGRSFDVTSPINTLAFESFMDELHKRDDANKELLLKWEWAFIPLSRHSSSKDLTSLLFEKLQIDPSFFVEILSFLYLPENSEEEVSNDRENNDNTSKNNAIRAFYLLREWSLIPGMDLEGNIDEKELRRWIDIALEKAKAVDRVKFVYVQLGELFAKYPEGPDNEKWPPKGLFSVMEDLHSDVLFTSYRVGMFNKRGFTSRGGYDGGDIERENASYFEGLKNQCLPLFPHVAKVFSDLSEEYLRMAKEMDERKHSLNSVN